MTGHDRLDIYLEGWRLGDGALSLTAVLPDFHYDDPNTGRIYCDGFVDFVEAFKADVAAINDGKLGFPFLTYTDVVVEATDGAGRAWCWWRATDTDFQGAALIHFEKTGVISERIAYFTELPE